ncbi:MAG TPA: VOC family protein [Gemmatimonadaceae bacterium]|nr:VOC family protein [Gemmatimonadaceae bacterium]
MRALPFCCALLLHVAARASAPGQAPVVEVDHLYVVVPRGAQAEIAALRAHGFFVDTTINRHTGYGTASVAVLFENAYLELLWLDPDVELAPEHEGRTDTLRRATQWRTSGVSPFGIGLRRIDGDTGVLPVPVHRDSAEYLAPGEAYEVLNQAADSMAADLFVLPQSRAVPSWVERAKARFPQLFEHAGGGRLVTHVWLAGPAAQRPVALATLAPRGLETRQADSALVELQLDGGRRGERIDLRPLLPVIIVR